MHYIFAIYSIPRHSGHSWCNVFAQRSYEEEKSVSEGSEEAEEEEDDDYVPYVPVKIRKQQMVGCAIIHKCLCQSC